MSKEAMKLALEALKNFEKAGLATLKTIDAIIALKQALSQPEPEPVAWTLLLIGEHHGIIGKAGETFESYPEYYKRVDVYTSPPKREPSCKTGSQCITKCMECAEQEPVIDKSAAIRIATSLGWTPKREWQGLTDMEMLKCWDSPLTPLGMLCARAIEAKLKEKNT